MNAEDQSVPQPIVPSDAPAPSSSSSGDVQKVDVKRVFAAGVNAYPPYRSKLDDLLKDEHRPDYERLLLQKTPVNRLWAWLKDRGYNVGRATVDRHAIKYWQGLSHVRQGAETAEEFARIARAAGLTLSESAVGGFHQMLMQFFTRAQVSEGLTAKDMQSAAAAVKGFVDVHQKVDEVRRELDRAKGPDADPGAVVDRVREILGLTEA